MFAPEQASDERGEVLMGERDELPLERRYDRDAGWANVCTR